MSIGSWDPQKGTLQATQRIDDALLRRFLALEAQGALDKLANVVSAEDRSQAQLMQAPLASWDAALENYDEVDLIALMRFFTCAEMQLPGWQAGEKSPVIAINKILKRRGHKLDKAVLGWIRQHSDNRFLPNGPIT